MTQDDEAARLRALHDYCVLDTGREAAFDDFALLAARVCDAPIALISLVDADRLFLKSNVGMPEPASPGGLSREAPYANSFCGDAIRQREVFVVHDAATDTRFATYPWVTRNPHIRFYAAAPLVTPTGHAIGTLCVLDRQPRDIDSLQKDALRVMARQVVAYLELRMQAVRDPLTHLFNRRYMHEILAPLVHRMERKQAPLTVLMIDLDRFKKFNDAAGHIAGDALLRATGHVLATSVRLEDVVCRYGGDEFTVVMPDAPIEVAYERAQHIRARIKQIEVGWGKPVTVSIGVAAYGDPASTPELLLEIADQALYQAKASGRDQVVVGRTNSNPNPLSTRPRRKPRE